MIFSRRNKHICDGPCKNKPDCTGVLVPCSAIGLNLSLSAYSPQIPGLHRIQRGKHAVVRKLNCYAGVNYSERAEKCYSKKKKKGGFRNAASGVQVLSFVTTMQRADC